jgi:ATP phosphoribosyltransferase regulatory subunit
MLSGGVDLGAERRYNTVRMALLPSGLQDILPPSAARERFIMGALLDRFSLFGYEQVTPPLLEFETSLFAGKGKAHAHNTFRVMDRDSQRMMGLRADITPQIERIATTLLASGQRLTRLSYVGQVLRVSPAGLSPLRQLRQAGLEMIGVRGAVSELEVLSAAAEALDKLGVSALVISLSHAGLFDALFAGCLPDSQGMIRKALYHKDVGALPLSMPYRELTIALLQEPLNAVLARSDVPTSIRSILDDVRSTQAQLQERFSKAQVASDPLDTDGFDYHDGLCFTLCDANSRQEIGRGGCYTLSDAWRGCGLTFYVERLVLCEITERVERIRKEIPASMPYVEAKRLRDAGTITTAHQN